jgi:hypothetical protein
MSQMKTSEPQTLQANGVMASRWRFCVITGDYTVGYAGAGVTAPYINIDTADAAGRGILVADKSGQSCKLEAGAAFAAGALLKPNASAQGIVCASGDRYSARSLQASTALLDVVEVEIVEGVAP